MVEPVLNFFEERSYFQIPVNRSPNVTKNHLLLPICLTDIGKLKYRNIILYVSVFVMFCYEFIRLYTRGLISL